MRRILIAEDQILFQKTLKFQLVNVLKHNE